MEIAIGLIAVGISTAIVFSYLIFIWWLDRYEREPFWMVIIAFLWGGLGGTLLGCVISLIISAPAALLLPETYSSMFSAVVAAPLAEEFTKGLIFVVLVFTPHLDNETDGLIYGAATGLGFAVIENLLYFASVAEMGAGVFFMTVVMRTLFTALVHAISSALLGYAIGYVRHRRLVPIGWVWPLAGFTLAVLNHALWNFLAVISGSGLIGGGLAAGAFGLGLLLVVVMSIVMFALTQFSLWREKKIIKRHLEDEARRGVLPARHAEIVPSWRKRRKKEWLPSHVPHKEYVRAATLLAFRHYQMETSAPRYAENYRRQVEDYRRQVRDLLS